MNCSCIDTEFDPYKDTLGGSVVETPVPLSNGLAIPTFGVLQSYNYFYTKCSYLPIGESTPQPFIQLSTTQEELPYFQETVTVGVQSYPEPVLEFPEGMEYEEIGDGHWKLYPIPGVTEVYLDVEYIRDYQTVEEIVGHISVNLVGYDSPEAVPFDVDIRVVAEDKEATFKISLEDPYINLSSDDVVLSDDNDNYAKVLVTSNLRWSVEF